MNFREGSKPALFLELAKPDEDGFSRRVLVSEFTGKYSKLTFGNGADWARDDGGLAKRYNILRVKEKGRVVAVELHGFNKHPINKDIPSEIASQVRKKRCAVLGIGRVEVDHKDGRRDNPSSTRVEDFQPLSKAANNAKRQHCKTCRETDNRFDARILGFCVAQWKGGETYRGSCVGCFWHDPRRFNHEISKRAAESSED